MSLSITFQNGAAQISARLKKAVAAKVARATEKRLRAGFRALLDATPVWSGDTIANYRVGVGSPMGGYSPYNQAENPLDPDFEGGDRDAAAARSEASLEKAIAQIYKNPFASVYVTNNIRYVDENGREYGIEALEHGDIGRIPYAMFARAKQVMEATDVSGL